MVGIAHIGGVVLSLKGNTLNLWRDIIDMWSIRPFYANPKFSNN